METKTLTQKTLLDFIGKAAPKAARKVEPKEEIKPYKERVNITKEFNTAYEFLKHAEARIKETFEEMHPVVYSEEGIRVRLSPGIKGLEVPPEKNGKPLQYHITTEDLIETLKAHGVKADIITYNTIYRVKFTSYMSRSKYMDVKNALSELAFKAGYPDISPVWWDKTRKMLVVPRVGYAHPPREPTEEEVKSIIEDLPL